MNAEFNWWLLIVGLVVGAGLVWLVILDSRRRESDIDAAETAREALWLSAVLADEGWDVTPATAERLLELHRAYLSSPPPDDPDDALTDPDVDQDWPSRTGSESMADDPTSTSDTPNVAGASSPATAAEAPAQ